MSTAWTTQALIAGGGPSVGYGSFVAWQHKDWTVRNMALVCSCIGSCGCGDTTATDAAAMNRWRSNVPHCPWPVYEDVVQWAHSEGVGAAMGIDETQNTAALETALLAAIDDISESCCLPYYVVDADRATIYYAADGVTVTTEAAGGKPKLAEVPARVALATVMHAHRLYRRRQSPDGTLGASAFGGAIRVSKYDPDVRALLANYLQVGVA